MRALVFFLTFGFALAHGQQTIVYNAGDNKSAAIAITATTNPTTLSISSGSATQSGVISDNGGSFAVNKTGAGSLTFTAANTYTGLTTISAGKLAMGSGGSLANSSGNYPSGINLAGSGTTFDISAGGNQIIQTLSGVLGSTVNLGANTLTLGVSGAYLPFNGIIQGSGGLVVQGGLGLAGVNTYTGPTTVNQNCNLELMAPSGSIAASSGVNLAKSGATLEVSVTSTTIQDLIGVAGSTVNLNAGDVLTLGSAHSTTFAGSIVNGNVGLIKQGTGTLTLTGINTYFGVTTVTGGTLALGPGGFSTSSINLAKSGTSFDISTAGNRTLADSDQLAALSGVVGSTVNLGAYTLTVNQSGGQPGGVSSFSGTIQGSGGLTKMGGGLLTVSGSNTYTGTTTVSGGILQFGKEISLYNGQAVNWSAPNINVSSGGTLAVNMGGTGEFSASDVTMLLANLSTGTGGFANGAIFGLDSTNAAGGSVTYAGAISDTHAGGNMLGLAKLGTGTLILSGANNYSGVTTVQGGTLALGAGGSVANSSEIYIYANGMTFDISGGGNQTIQDLLSGAPGGVVNLGANNLTLGSSRSTAFAGVIKGTGSLTKQNTGTQILSGTNTYTGATTVKAGTLLVNGSLAQGSNVVVNAGAILGGSGTINGAVNVSSGGILSSGSTGVSTLTMAGLTLNGGSVMTYNFSMSPSKIALTGSYVAPTTGTVTINLLPPMNPGTYTLLTGATGVTASSFTLGTVPSGYTYQLTAANGTLTVMLGAIPASPVGLYAQPNNKEIDLMWMASPFATSYNVLRSLTSGGPYTTIATGVSIASYTDSGVTNGTTYYYTVTATNASGTSGASNEASAKPFSTPIVDSWTSNDIGSVSLPGSATYSAGTFTLNGAGASFSGYGDRFNYAYQPLVGDGTIVACVTSQTNGESGVVIRENLATNAKAVDLTLRQNVGAFFRYRTLVGSYTANNLVSLATVPYWLKLSRVGDTFTGYTSPDGVAWTQVGTTTDAMAASVYVGLAQSSVSDGFLTTATFTNVSILPTSAWASQDIGTVPNVGASYYSNGVATINGSGADIWGAADQFRYTYLAASADCDITVRVTSVGNTDAWAKAGVMIRESLAAGSRHASVFVSPGSGIAFLYRSSTGGASNSVHAPGLKAPYWLRVVRSGNTFTGYCSPDGTAWTVVGSQSITMATNVYIGLPVCSHNAHSICTSVFDNIIGDP